MNCRPIIHDMFVEGASIRDIMARFAESSRPRSYLNVLKVLKDMHLSMKGKIDYDRDWEEDELRLLRTYARKGDPVESIRKRLYRTPSAVRAKIAELAAESALFERAKREEKAREVLLYGLSAPWGPATRRGYCLWGDRAGGSAARL